MNQIHTARLIAWIGPSGKGDLYRFSTGARENAVKLVVTREPNGYDLRRDKKYQGKTPEELMNCLSERQRTRARIILDREYQLAQALKHINLHPMIEYNPNVPALAFIGPKGSIAELRNACKHEPHDPFLYAEAFTPITDYGAKEGSRMWHGLMRELVSVTRFLLERGYAHLNLCPDTILYAGQLPHIHCWVSDYGSLAPSSEVVKEPQQLENYRYSLPRRNQSARTQAQAQLVSVLLDLIRFCPHPGAGFCITETEMYAHNVCATVARVDCVDALPPTSPLYVLRETYRRLKDGLTRHTDEVLGALSLLFMASIRICTPEADAAHVLDNTLRLLEAYAHGRRE